MGVRLVNILSVLLLISLYSCSDDSISYGNSSGDVVTARLSLLSTSDAESDAVENVSAYRFDGGMLAEVFDKLEPGTDGVVSLKPSAMSGNVYFMINAGNLVSGRVFVRYGIYKSADIVCISCNETFSSENRYKLSNQ